jgi:hypothetical protein
MDDIIHRPPGDSTLAPLRDAAAMEQVVAKIPNLTDFGFEERPDRDGPRGRAALFEPKALRAFAMTCAWLRCQTKTKNVNRRLDSHFLAHLVRALTGNEAVTNGVLIAAAIVCGFQVERCGPNALLNISHRAACPPWGLKLCEERR